MSDGDLHLSEDVSVAGWIAPRLTGAFGEVTRTVPSGYPAYARICHPAEDGEGGWASWARVARATGRSPHPRMQWHALIGSADPFNTPGPLWPGRSPQRGHLNPDILGALCDVLARHTSTPRNCFFCLWEGWGWIGGDHVLVDPAADEPIPPSFAAHEINGRRVRHPGRDYLLLAGPLHAALQIGWWPRPDWFDPQSPNIFWPADRAWCVASEINFDSTLVAGSPELIAAVIAAPALDAWRVDPDDSLAADADQVNPCQ